MTAGLELYVVLPWSRVATMYYLCKEFTVEQQKKQAYTRGQSFLLKLITQRGGHLKPRKKTVMKAKEDYATTEKLW